MKLSISKQYFLILGSVKIVLCFNIVLNVDYRYTWIFNYIIFCLTCVFNYVTHTIRLHSASPNWNQTAGDLGQGTELLFLYMCTLDFLLLENISVICLSCWNMHKQEALYIYKTVYHTAMCLYLDFESWLAFSPNTLHGLFNMHLTYPEWQWQDGEDICV